MSAFLRTVVSLSFLFLLVPSIVSAQEAAVLVADVTLDAVLVEQTSPQSFDISFSLVNQEGVQPGVQYALFVVEEDTKIIVDGISSEGSFTLYENQPREELVTYTAPETLDGDYLFTLEVRTQDGLSLVSQILDFVTFEGTGTAAAFEEVLLPTALQPVESTTLDADWYQAGDTAMVNVVLTTSEDATVEVVLTDGEGSVCGSGNVTASIDTPLVTVPVDIMQECVDPTASVVVKNAVGATLDKSEYRVETQPEENDMLMILLVIGGVVLALIIGRMIYRHKTNEDSPKLTLSIALMLLGVSFFTFASQAEAKTWKQNTSVAGCPFFVSASVGHDGGVLSFITAYLNNIGTTFTPGETVVFQYTADNKCKSVPGENPAQIYIIQSLASSATTARVNNGSSKSRSIPGYAIFKTGTLNFSAPSQPGQHNVNFSTSVSTPSIENGKVYRFSGSVPFTVQGGPEPSVELQISTDGQNWSSATSVQVVAQKSMIDTFIPKAHAGGSVTVTQGDTVYLKWESENTRSCAGRNFNASGANGQATTQPDADTTYRISCEPLTSGNAPATDSVQAKVNPAVAAAAPEVSIRARVKTPSTGPWHTSAFSIEDGDGIQINYSSQNTVRCDSSDFSTFGATNGWRGSISEPAPGNSKTYTVSCVNEDGVWGSDSIRVSTNEVVEDDSPTASFSANPSSTEEGGPVTLSWGSTNAAWCTGWEFATGGSPSGSKTINVYNSTTYGVTCWEDGRGQGRRATASQYVSVSAEPSTPSNPSPTATLEVRNDTQGGGWTSSNITIIPGDQISLQWSSSNADSCNGSNFNTGGADDGSTSNVTEPSGGNRTTYSVTCTGDGGSDSDSLRVTSQAVDPELSVSDVDVRKGESVTISYNMQGNDPAQCSLTGPGVSYLAGSFSNQTGSLNVTISGDSTFVLTCPGGSDEVRVELIPIFFDS